MEENHNTCQLHHDHDATLISEIVHHIPYAIFSVAVGFILLSLLDYQALISAKSYESQKGAWLLFHSFHFLHIVFAATGSLVAFSRFSHNMLKGIIVSIISSLFFCTLSDVFLPYLSGRILGVEMHFHWCIATEWHNVVPLLFVGILNGWVMSKHNETLKSFYSLGSHFSHILISSLASMFYLVAEGFTQWCAQMGILFIFLIIAVVIPCTFADVIVPIYFARMRNKDEKHKT